jgi:clan AA aspartic protease (TIGR02281 family)
MHTASGIAAAAFIMIEEIVIGGIVVKNVQGSVIQGYDGQSLLGMSFLRKLAGF